MSGHNMLVSRLHLPKILVVPVQKYSKTFSISRGKRRIAQALFLMEFRVRIIIDDTSKIEGSIASFELRTAKKTFLKLRQW